MSDNSSPSLGGNNKPASGDAPSLPYNRKQVQGIGKNQKLLMGWLYDQGRAMTWLEVLGWWTEHLTKRYEKPIRADLKMFNAMLGGLKHRKLIAVTYYIEYNGQRHLRECSFVSDTYYGERVTVEAVKGNL